jgi:farnesyl-diphosphate farnesyltransferase
VLDSPREATSVADIERAITLFERGGAKDFALGEIRRLRRAVENAVDGAQHPALHALLQQLCELVLAPIGGLLGADEIARAVGVDDLGASDAAFCAALLPKVSRTFALSIEMLGPQLRASVRVAYLLCRIVDTIEDDERLSQESRKRLFDCFESSLCSEAGRPDLLQDLSQALDLGRGADAELCGGSGAVIRSFRHLDPREQDAIRPHVLEMSLGMREYTARADRDGKLRLRDLPDLERYCYFVAGTVGKLLTALFELRAPGLDEERRRAISERAVSFGLGLQMVNIVKDVAGDYHRGDCYIPQSLAQAHGLATDRILDPLLRGPALATVREICEVARRHLARAREYTTLWPEQGGEEVRLFCAVPLALALATLTEVEQGGDTLRQGATPKVSRETVAEIVHSARDAVHDNRSLSQMLNRYSPQPAAGV